METPWSTLSEDHQRFPVRTLQLIQAVGTSRIEHVHGDATSQWQARKQAPKRWLVGEQPNKAVIPRHNGQLGTLKRCPNKKKNSNS